MRCSRAGAAAGQRFNPFDVGILFSKIRSIHFDERKLNAESSDADCDYFYSRGRGGTKLNGLRTTSSIENFFPEENFDRTLFEIIVQASDYIIFANRCAS